MVNHVWMEMDGVAKLDRVLTRFKILMVSFSFEKESLT